jgi:Zn-dependent protease
MNYTVVRIWGIPIRLNISLLVFLPLLAFLIGSGTQLSAYASLINALAPVTVDAATLTGPTDRWVIGASAAIGLFVSVTLHELGHAWVAMRYDIRVESITLWILGGLADLSEMPREWNREFWIAVAGPITSILVGLGCLGVLTVLPESATVVTFVVGFLAVMNLILAVFNMLPAFPMDGGRILRALLARKRSYVSATRTAATVGKLFALIFVFLGIVVAFSPMLLLLALFIYVAASSESRAVVLGELLAGLTVDDLVPNDKPVSADVSVEKMFDRLLGARRTDLPVVDEHGAIVGIVTASALREVPPAEYATTPVRSIATTDLPRLEATTSAFDAFYEMRQQRSDVVLVERNGSPIGLVSRGDFAAALDLRRDTVPF